MKEIKVIILTQLTVVVLLVGVFLGTLTCVRCRYTATVVVKEYIKLPGEDFVVERAYKDRHGTLYAYYKYGVWRFINKSGIPCKVFVKLKDIEN